MTTVSELTLAICRFLGSTGEAVFREVGKYQSTDNAVVVKHLPTEPDTAVAVNVYDMGDHVGVARTEVMVQLRFRAGGKRTAVDEFADAIKPYLHNRHGFTMDGIRISRCRRVNIAPLGPDQNGREERTDNYALILAP